MIINAFAFASSGEVLEGEIRLSELTRLDLLESGGVIAYRVHGFVGERGRQFLDMALSGTLKLRCERCLQPMDWPLAITTVVWLASSEEEADSLPLEEDRYDAVVGSETFDLGALMEDEILLAIPPSPRHERCPAPLSVRKDEPASPFAALASLKTPKNDTGGAS